MITFQHKRKIACLLKWKGQNQSFMFVFGHRRQCEMNHIVIHSHRSFGMLTEVELRRIKTDRR